MLLANALADPTFIANKSCKSSFTRSTENCKIKYNLMKKIIYVIVGLLLSTNIFGQTPLTLKISGEIPTPLQLTLKDIADMPHTTAILKSKDGKSHTYRGVPLQIILSRAGATTSKAVHGKNLSKYLLVKCADGYEVLFSLAELDSNFTNKKIILADSIEGKPLIKARGPLRIIVPGEKKPARSCFQVTELIVNHAKD